MSTRLELISKQINKNEKVVDVGTDHALLPIILLKNNITSNIVASDINEQPLNAARENLNREGLLDKVEIIKSNGVEDIDISNVDVIVIAGMGATTINNILNQKDFNGRYIIHSTTHIDDVRKHIQDIGHTITNEWVDQEGKIYNIVIETKPGKSNLTEKELFLGPILMNKRQEAESYYAFLLRTLTKNVEDSGIEDLKEKERTWLKEQLWNE